MYRLIAKKNAIERIEMISGFLEQYFEMNYTSGAPQWGIRLECFNDKCNQVSVICPPWEESENIYAEIGLFQDGKLIYVDELGYYDVRVFFNLQDLINELTRLGVPRILNLKRARIKK